ncbi:MAG: polysaccharide deacetylase family protein [Deltaproteobacteria bacterium]|nr:polysaccharide deacetylase family protein [Deltaproteobacteria bacterium]
MVHLTIAAPAWAGSAQKAANQNLPGVVYHGPREDKRIALTFDACSSRRGDKVDQAVVDELIALDVPATLFLGGKWMRDEPAIVDRLAANPQFDLETHGYMHPHLTKLTSPEVQADLAKAESEFEGVLGRKPELMRAPYGELDARVAKVILDNGITPVQFDLPGADSTFSKATLVKWVVGQAKPGSIVVLHMNGHGKHTAEALPEIVSTLRKQGYTFVTVSELLGRPVPEIAEPILVSEQPKPSEAGPMCSDDDPESNPLLPDDDDAATDDTPEDAPAEDAPTVPGDQSAENTPRPVPEAGRRP